MIVATKEPLAEGAEAALRTWLKKSEFAALRRVIESKGKIHAVAVSNKAIESKTYELKIAEANDELNKAQRYAAALEVLDEISKQTEPFTIVKLT